MPPPGPVRTTSPSSPDREEPKSAPSRVRDGHRVTRVHDQLRNQILRGEILPGTSMSQVEMAERLDAGRTPLREALRLLQSEGLIVAEPNRNVLIAEFTVEDVEDLYLMRIALECSATLITVPDLRPAELAEISGFLGQMEYFESEQDQQGWEAPHREFHMKLIGRSGPGLKLTIEQLWDHAGRFRRVHEFSDPPPWLSRRSEHRALLEAAKALDGAEVCRRLALHYAGTVVRIARRADPPPTLETLRTLVRKFADTDRLPDTAT